MKWFLGVILSLIMSSALLSQNKITSSVLSNGAIAISNSNFRVIGTLGQPAIGTMSSDNFRHQAGFWYTTFDIVTAVEQVEGGVLPTEFRLEQNYPNPFNPATTIQFQVVTRTNVKLQIFDVLGRRVATLVDQIYKPGVYKLVFDAADLASGMYIYRIQAGSFVETRKLMLLK